MNSKIRFLEIAFAIVCVLFIALGWFSFKHLKDMETEFNEKKAILVKENLDLKDRLKTLEKTVVEKTNAVRLLEKVKTSMDAELAALREENKKLLAAQVEELEDLKRENILLSEKISSLEAMSTAQQMQLALEKEKDNRIKSILKDALDKIKTASSGKGAIDLKSIVVTKKKESEYYPSSRAKLGEITSINKKYNLIAINLGRANRIKEGDRCVILKDDREVASAEIISVRYKISAALVDDIAYGYKFRDIKRGDKVLVE